MQVFLTLFIYLILEFSQI